MSTKILTIVVTVALVAGGALAHSGVKNDTVLARMESMDAMRKQMKLLGQMAKGETDFDPVAAQAAVERIEALADETPALFEVPAQDPNSEARPIIWEDFSAFTKEAEALKTVSASLTIEDKEALGPTLKQLGTACKSCHGRFRE